MKKSLLLSLLLAICISVTAQNWVTIPDANYVIKLTQLFPQCMDGNLMNTECPDIVNTTVLNVNNSNISNLSGIEYFTSLQTLKCNSNNLTFLPELPATLTVLWCGNNNLSSLPALPASLTELRCFGNNLSTIPTLPATLLQLSCYSNNISILPELPQSLTILSCGSNNLASLPELPPFLTNLGCAGNNLSELPELPPLLTSLNCGQNNINSLPELPASLTILSCNSNNLTLLPDLPPFLTNLSCGLNNLISLPELPPTLTSLFCRINNLTSLPNLPVALTSLTCDSNQLTCLPTLPSTLTNNENIYGFNLSLNPFTCLPNYVPAMSGGSNSYLLGYPLCDMDDLIGNPFGCTSAAGISGTVFSDENLNCLEDGQESQLANIQLQLYNENDSLVSLTSTFGNTVNSQTVYHFTPETGTYTVFLNTENMPFQVSCMNPGDEQEITLSESNLSELNIDFAVECLPGFDVGVQSVVSTGFVFPGQVHTLKIAAGDMSSWYGLQCAQSVGGTVTVYVDGPVNYLGPAANSLSPLATGDLQFTYDIADFSLVNFQEDFALMMGTDTTAMGEELVCVFVTITPLGGDINPENNTKHHCYSVLNSYDPNIKQVWPQNVEPGFDGYFNYTIYFQNTGTAPAFNIRLADTLDTNLDLSTFQVTNYSHPVLTYVHGNVLTFRFNNIMLPDSTTDLEGSIGFVQYRIKPVAGLLAGTVIENTAHIFFDFNDAIVTNTTVNEYMIPTSVAGLAKQNNLMLFPNPATGLFTIEWNNHNTQSTIEVFNMNGARVLQKQSNQNREVMDLSSYPAGVYMVRVSNSQTVMQTKLIKR